MEYKNLLQNWKLYQKCQFKKRLEMANTFPCNLYSKNVRITEATLSFITEGEHRLEVRDGEIFSGTITLRNLHGYSSEGRNIRLTLRPEEPPIILQFQTEAIQAVALIQLENFTREIVNEPTLPSSSESDEDFFLRVNSLS